MPLQDHDYEDPPDNVKVFFNLQRGETNLTVLTFEQVPVLPRTGEVVFLGSHGSFDVVGVRHEYLDRQGTASPLLGRVTVLLKKRAAKK